MLHYCSLTGASGTLFTGINYNLYQPPPGFWLGGAEHQIWVRYIVIGRVALEKHPATVNHQIWVWFVIGRIALEKHPATVNHQIWLWFVIGRVALEKHPGQRFITRYGYRQGGLGENQHAKGWSWDQVKSAWETTCCMSPCALDMPPPPPSPLPLPCWWLIWPM